MKNFRPKTIRAGLRPKQGLALLGGPARPGPCAIHLRPRSNDSTHTHTNPSSSSSPAPPNPPPASSHHRSTLPPRRSSPLAAIATAVALVPPLLRCYRIGGGVEIDPVLEFPLLVRNPNLVGWDFHPRQRARDRSTSADAKGLGSRGAGAVDFLGRLGFQLKPPCSTLRTTPAGDDEDLRAARGRRLLVQLRPRGLAASAAAAAGSSCPGGGAAAAASAAAAARAFGLR